MEMDLDELGLTNLSKNEFKGFQLHESGFQMSYFYWTFFVSKHCNFLK